MKRCRYALAEKGAPLLVESGGGDPFQAGAARVAAATCITMTTVFLELELLTEEPRVKDWG